MRQLIADADHLTVTLRHPLNGIIGVAVLLESWIHNGRIIGLVLQFPDGHTASLTHAEIRALQATDTDDAPLLFARKQQRPLQSPN